MTLLIIFKSYVTYTKQHKVRVCNLLCLFTIFTCHIISFYIFTCNGVEEIYISIPNIYIVCLKYTAGLLYYIIDLTWSKVLKELTPFHKRCGGQGPSRTDSRVEEDICFRYNPLFIVGLVSKPFCRVLF